MSMNDMTAEPVAVQSGRVTTEGDDLYYEVRGDGPPLLMIAGGGGDAWWYIPVARRLASDYKVILYDRRANARSTMHAPQHFDIHQESRDAVAVLHAAGEQSAVVFGNSSGAVIALDMATTQPDAVRAVIAHEPPLATVHPDAEKWQRFFTNVHRMSFRFGASLAALRFALGVGLPLGPMIKGDREAQRFRVESGESYIDSRAASAYLIQQELLPVTHYAPDVERLKQSGIPIFMAAGQASLDQGRFYAQTAGVLAQRLGSELVIFPGHHMSFWNMADAWTSTLRGVLRRAQEARA